MQAGSIYRSCARTQAEIGVVLLERGDFHRGVKPCQAKFDKNVGWVYRSLEFDNAILREGDPVTVGAGILICISFNPLYVWVNLKNKFAALE